MEYKKRPIEERFWEKVDKRSNNECWNWISYTRNKGNYGSIKINKKQVPAHRLSWEIHNGPIPKGKGYHGICVLHKCDNRLCVNPKHLFLGSHLDNIDDKVKKNRQMKGEEQIFSKLTEKEVLEIRSRPIYWGSQADLAEEFNLKQSTIHHIIKRKSWKHI